MKKTIKILFFMCIIFSLLSIFNKVNAASASISAKKTSANVGDNVTISVNINAASWNLTVSGSGISDSIVGYDSDANNVSTKKSYTLNTSSAGTYTVTLSGDVTDGVTDVNSPINQTVTVTVTQPEPSKNEGNPGGESGSGNQGTGSQDGGQQGSGGQGSGGQGGEQTSTPKSNIARLKYLGIDQPSPEIYDFSGFAGNEDNPNWKAAKKFPNEISKIYIKAIPNFNGKVISGDGWRNIPEGRTELKIVVQSEDGQKTKEYKILVEREVASAEPDDENVDENTSDDIAVGLSKLEIAGLTFTPEFNTNEYKYTIEGKLEDFESVEEFKKLIIAEANFEGAKIEITSEEEEFKVGRNKILITVKDSDGREIAIYTIILKLTEKEETVVGKVEDDNKDNEEKKNIEWNKIIVVSAIAIIVIYSIVISIIGYKQRETLESNGLVEKREDEEEEYNTFKEIKAEEKEKFIEDEEPEIIENNVTQEVEEESEEEIRRRKIEEFLRGRDSKH